MAAEVFNLCRCHPSLLLLRCHLQCVWYHICASRSVNTTIVKWFTICRLPPQPATAAAERPAIALEAVCGRLPHASSASSPSGFQLPAKTLDAVRRVSLDRWDADWLFSETSAAGKGAGLAGHFGTFVAGWAGFDHATFGLAPAEALVMDPQQRVLLEVRDSLALTPLLRGACDNVHSSSKPRLLQTPASAGLWRPLLMGYPC